MSLSIGVDVGGTKVLGGVVDETGKIITLLSPCAAPNRYSAQAAALASFSTKTSKFSNLYKSS